MQGSCWKWQRARAGSISRLGGVMTFSTLVSRSRACFRRPSRDLTRCASVLCWRAPGTRERHRSFEPTDTDAADPPSLIARRHLRRQEPTSQLP